jgi:DNA mismatch repair ATPase MutS
MLASFAEYINTNSMGSMRFLKPQFDKNLFLQNTYHPILKLTQEKESIVIGKDFRTNQALVHKIDKIKPISQICANESKPFVVIFGNNMSGKSTILKQIGCLQIMSQSSCFIPRSLNNSLNEKCELSLIKNILSISCDYTENINILNQSSFEQETYEINSIIQNLEENTLILIDELCRSTYLLEGFALSLVLCDYILDEFFYKKEFKNIRIFFATHFNHLSYLKRFYSKINSSICMETILNKGNDAQKNNRSNSESESI